MTPEGMGADGGADRCARRRPPREPQTQALLARGYSVQL